MMTIEISKNKFYEWPFFLCDSAFLNGFELQTSWGGTPNVIVRKSTF